MRHELEGQGPIPVVNLPVNFTIEVVDGATIITAAIPGEGQGIGLAAPAHADYPVDKIGQGIALGRALKDLGEGIERTWLGRVVSKAEVAAKRGAKAQPADATIVRTHTTYQVEEETVEIFGDPYLIDLLALHDLGGEG